MARHRRPTRPTDPGHQPGPIATVLLWTYRAFWCASTLYDFLKEVVVK